MVFNVISGLYVITLAIGAALLCWLVIHHAAGVAFSNNLYAGWKFCNPVQA